MNLNIYKDIYNYFSLILLLGHRDLLVKVADTKLGLMWIIIPALLPIAAYTTLAILGIKGKDVGMPFVIYIATGFTIYMFMSSFIKATIKAYDDKVLLNTFNLPFIVVVIIKNQTTFLEFSVRVLFLIGIYTFFNIQVSLSLLTLPLLILIMMMFSFSVGIFAGLLNIVYKDISQLIRLFLRYGLFLSSVIFPFPQDGWVGTIGNFNVFNTFVVNIRNIIVYGFEAAHNSVFIITIILTFIVYLLAVTLLHYKEHRIKEFI